MRKSPPVPVAAGEVPIGVDSYVYKAYGHDGTLLYVGVTDDLFSRLHHHRIGMSRWIYEARRIGWETYPDRLTAERAERMAIQALRPLHNVRDNGEVVMARQMGHGRCYAAEAWERLGRVIRVRRTEMRRPQRSIAGDSRVDVAELRALEAGARVRYDEAVLLSVERTLNWRPGSVEAVLAGGDPDPMSPEENRERAFAAHGRFGQVA